MTIYLERTVAHDTILCWQGRPQVATVPLAPGHGICRDPRAAPYHSESANFNTSPRGFYLWGAKRRARQVIFSRRSYGTMELNLLQHIGLCIGRLFLLSTRDGYYGSWGH